MGADETRVADSPRQPREPGIPEHSRVLGELDDCHREHVAERRASFLSPLWRGRLWRCFKARPLPARAATCLCAATQSPDHCMRCLGIRVSRRRTEWLPVGRLPLFARACWIRLPY